MSTSEPDAWTFSGDKFKIYDSETSSSEDSSDDEQIFAKSNVVRKTKYKKLEVEELLPE